MVNNSDQKGISLVETLVAVFLFLLLSVGIYEGFVQIFNVVRTARLKVTVSALATEQFEIIRNLPYTDVGTLTGLPSGKIQQNQTIIRDNVSFAVKTTIRSIDDPFDGTIGNIPNDLSPADFKLIELEISCAACKNFSTLTFDTYAAPKNLESASTNGALFIRVFDANGQSVQNADVHIENNQASPPITIDDVTNNNGMLQIVDALPGVEAYEITVSKTGYSQDKTYPNGALPNPNPSKPHATVAIQQVTQISFAIDKVGSLDIESQTQTCLPVSGIDFDLRGSKLIGSSPDVYKYQQNHITDSQGHKLIDNLEWDTYYLNLTDDAYDLIGAVGTMPLNLNPDSLQNLKLILAPKNPRSLLITAKDASTQLPLSDASITLSKTGFSETLTSGRGFLRQADWSGGWGQADFLDPAKYFTQDNNIETSDPAGELKLKKVLDQYEASGYLISSTFDTGSKSNFYQIIWQPQGQPMQTGNDSVKFQIATNNDNATWNFLGPDGTASTYYTLADSNINSAHNNDRYLRYAVFLQTTDVDFTPNVGDIAFTFTSSCVPPGQVIFSDLSLDDYDLTVSKAGYQTYSDTVSISADWQQKEVILSP